MEDDDDDNYYVPRDWSYAQIIKLFYLQWNGNHYIIKYIFIVHDCRWELAYCSLEY